MNTTETEASQNGIVSRLMDNPFALAIFPIAIIFVLLILGGACEPQEQNLICVSQTATHVVCEEVDDD